MTIERPSLETSRVHIPKTPWSLLVAVGIVLLVLFAGNIRTPFEWDEFLFARAVEKYDAAANSPHMPGYPAFVFATRIASLVGFSAVQAPQITSLAAAFLTLLCVYSLAQRLGFEGIQQWGAPTLLAVCPSFLWFAGVGLSDVAGALGSTAVLWAILRGREATRTAIATGVIAAIGIGFRAQAVYILPAMAIIAIVEWRTRTIQRLLIALGAFLLTSCVIWIPAILITGPNRWWRAFLWQVQWVRQEQLNGLSLPYSPWSWFMEGWLIKPFGTSWLAGAFGLLVLAGITLQWKAGRRRAVLYCLGLGLISLMMAAFSLDLRDGPRYVIPSLVFFSFLISGAIGNKSWQQRLVVIGAISFMAASVIWLFPGLSQRGNEMAPVSKVLEDISDSTEAVDTVVFFEGKLWPQTHWILERRGYLILPIEKLDAWREQHPNNCQSLISIHSNRGPTPQNALFESTWNFPHAKAMTRGRYLRCWAVER